MALVAIAAVLWDVIRPLEPRYGGKPLSHWLEGGCSCGYGPISQEGMEAVRAVGTNAIPFLIGELQAKGLPLLSGFEPIADRVPSLWSFSSAPIRHSRALHGFDALGPAGSPAIPKLGELMFGPDKYVGMSAQVALERIGGSAVLPPMMCGLTNENLASESVCYLGSLRSQAQAAVPALVTNLAAIDPVIRKYAALALRRINLQPEIVVPALLPLVSDTNRDVRLNAISALAAFGPGSAAANPALQSAAVDPDKRVNARAKWALIRVECEMRDGGIVRGPKARKAIALAFTGHEFAEGSETILDELTKHQAKASFFFTGDFMRNPNFESLIQRIIHGNHLLGPHSDKHLLYCSWDTDRKTLVTEEQFSQDLESNRHKIQVAINRLDEKKQGKAVDPAVLEAFKRRYGIEGSVSGRLSDSNQVVHARQEYVPGYYYFLPAYEHYNRQIADWASELGMELINYTPGTRSNADYTGEADKNFVSSQAIFDSILKKEREDPNGLNGFILLLHIGSGPGRADKFHTRFGELLDVLAAKGYQFVRVDELLEPKETK